MRTVASIVLLIILVPATIAVFFVSSLKFNVVTAKYLKQELVKQNAYGIAEDQLRQQIEKVELKDLPVTAADLTTLASHVVSATWLQQQVENVVTNVFTWFNGPPTAVLSVPIDLTTPKAALVPGIDTLIANAIPRLPACSKTSGALCNKSGMTVDQVKALLKDQGIDFSTVTSQLPNSVDLANPVLPDIKLGKQDSQNSTQQQDKNTQQNNTSPQPNNQDVNNQQQNGKPVQPSETPQQKAQKVVESLTKAKTQYHKALQIWMYALIGYAVLILGFLAINFAGLHRLVRWAGVLCVTISVIPLALASALGPVIKQLAIPRIDLSGAPAAVQTAVPSAILDTVHALTFPVLLVSAILFVLGLVGIVEAHWVVAKVQKK